MKWCIEEDLSLLSDLNIGKSVGLLFNLINKKGITDLDMKIEGQKIPMVNETKFLGVWINRKLNWKTHTNEVWLKKKRNMNLLQQSKNLLPIHAKKSFTMLKYTAKFHMVY